GWVAPFGDPRINACSRLPVAFRSVPRPSSPPGAKASTECPSYTRYSGPAPEGTSLTMHRNHPRTRSSGSGRPLSETINVPSSETINVPSSETINVPSSETINVPSSETINVPSSETINVPSSETINVPSSETINVP